MSSTATTAIQNIRLGSQAAVVSHTGLGRLSMSVDGGLGNNRIYALRPQQTRCLFIAFEEGQRGNGLFRRRICRRPNPHLTAFFTRAPIFAFSALVADVAILIGKFYFDMAQVTYAEIGLLVAASVWNSWPRSAATTGFCSACVPAEVGFTHRNSQGEEIHQTQN